MEKIRQKKVVKKQKEVIKINFVGKTINEIYMRLGDPNLFRLDGNTQTMRFDSDACRLFLFFNSTIPMPQVNYFEVPSSAFLGSVAPIKSRFLFTKKYSSIKGTFYKD